jgi:hypothetical protein
VWLYQPQANKDQKRYESEVAEMEEEDMEIDEDDVDDSEESESEEEEASPPPKKRARKAPAKKRKDEGSDDDSDGDDSDDEPWAGGLPSDKQLKTGEASKTIVLVIDLDSFVDSSIYLPVPHMSNAPRLRSALPS